MKIWMNLREQETATCPFVNREFLLSRCIDVKTKRKMTFARKPPGLRSDLRMILPGGPAPQTPRSRSKDLRPFIPQPCNALIWEFRGGGGFPPYPSGSLRSDIRMPLFLHLTIVKWWFDVFFVYNPIYVYQ
jgi:hypothetical protein